MQKIILLKVMLIDPDGIVVHSLKHHTYLKKIVYGVKLKLKALQDIKDLLPKAVYGTQQTN
jgi:hypothetical protein